MALRSHSIRKRFIYFIPVNFEGHENYSRNLQATMDSQHIYNQVAERYSAASKSTTLDYGEAVARAFGYSEAELKDIPKESNLGLSCGNPMAMASIREVS